jgi:hypothetical protein
MTILQFLYIVVGVASALLLPDSGPRPELGYLVSRDSDIFSQLGNQLSPGASIIRQDDPRMQSTYQRWQAYSMPTYSAVVEVTIEDDVQKTVRRPEHALREFNGTNCARFLSQTITPSLFWLWMDHTASSLV